VRLPLAVAAAAAALLASPVGAHPPITKRVHSKPLAVQERILERAYRHHLYVAANGRAHSRFWHRRASGWTLRSLGRVRERLHAIPEPWWSLFRCEHGFAATPDWTYDGPSGFDGGPQFHPGTWNNHKHAAGAGGYAYAHQAPPHVQLAVARVTQAREGWGAWPTCSRLVGLR
jgi:hypothetical protein